MKRTTTKWIVALAMLMVAMPNVEARRVEAASAAEIKGVELAPGDTLVLKSGEWKDQVVKIHAVGTQEAPIYIVAEEKGKTFCAVCTALVPKWSARARMVSFSLARLPQKSAMIISMSDWM